MNRTGVSRRIVGILTAAPGRIVSLLTVVVVCLLVPFLVLAQAATAQAQAQVQIIGSAAAGDTGVVGYRLEGEEVVFTFDRSRYGVATRGDNGQRVAM
ncbi:MAG: hypothetical protein KAW67_05650, partial [Candidatus Eisenbacteria sp.]|nr:hypothetical protein [Candidatus Eisenbacteria bacterium]